MAKKIIWEIEREEKHTVELEYGMISGKAIVTIDEDRFDISVKPFRLRGSNQIFKLGEEMAILDFPQKGAPQVIVGGEAQSPKKKA